MRDRKKRVRHFGWREAAQHLPLVATGVAEPRGSVPERSAIEKERAWTAPSIAPELIFTQNRTKLQKLGIHVQ